MAESDLITESLSVVNTRFDANFATPSMIDRRLVELVESEALSQENYAQIVLALDMSQKIYSGISRKDRIRDHLSGHIYPGLMVIMDNYPKILAYLNDENTFGSQIDLTKLLITFIGHDWYEDYASPDRLDELRRTVKLAFQEIGGDEIDTNIHALSKFPAKTNETLEEKEKRMAEYFDNLMNANKSVAIIKLIDRLVNHLDDFGSSNPEMNSKYIEETREFLFPVFQKFNVPLFDLMLDLIGDEETGKVGTLQQDIAERRDFLGSLKAVSEKLFQDSPRDGHREHIERTLKLYRENRGDYGLRDTVGMEGAIRLHDFVDALLNPNFMSKDELKRLIESSPKFWLYAIGIGLARNKYDDFTKNVRSRMGVYSHIDDPNIRSQIREINTDKLFLTREELKRTGLLGGNVIPSPIDFDSMSQILETDIEGLHVLVVETIDNLANPPVNELGEMNAAYQWKAAQELLILAPMLELAGFTKLAQVANGKALEFLYQDSPNAEKVKAEYTRYMSFRDDNMENIRLAFLNSSATSWETGVFANTKTLGGAIEKYKRQTQDKTEDKTQEKGERSPNDILRYRVIFSDDEAKDMPEVLAKTLQMVEDTLRGLNGINDYTVTIEHPYPPHSIKVRSAFNIKDEQMLELVGRWEALTGKKPDLRFVNSNEFQAIQFQLKFQRKSEDGVEDEDPIYVEVAAMNQTMHWINSVDAAHVAYKMKELGVQGEIPTNTMVEKIMDFYRRGANYRLAPRANLYLTDEIIDLIDKIFKDRGIDIPKDKFGVHILEKVPFNKRLYLMRMLMDIHSYLVG